MPKVNRFVTVEVAPIKFGGKYAIVDTFSGKFVVSPVGSDMRYPTLVDNYEDATLWVAEEHVEPNLGIYNIFEWE